LRNSLLRLAPLALAGFVGAAFADDSGVTIYGILDTAIANIQHALSFDANHPVANNPTVTKGTDSATGMLNGGMSATRWGIKGQEDLGGGTKAVFLLEQGFNLGSGNVSNAALGLANNKSTGPTMSADSAVSGQFFNRGAYVGLSSNQYGTLTAGRQQSFFLDNIAIFDPMMGSQAFSPLGFSGSYGGGGFTDDSRVDNSLKYKLAVGDFTLGAMYKIGGVAGGDLTQSAWLFNGVYAAGPFAAQLGYEYFRDAFSVSNNTGTGSVKVTAADTKALMAAAKYTYEHLTIRGGYEREEIENPSNPGQDLLLTSIFGEPVASVTVNAYPNQKNLNVYWIGGGYDFTPAFTLLAGVYHVSQNAYNCKGQQIPIPGQAAPSASACSGANNYYSLVADYNLSKRTDLYVGWMDSLVSGGVAAAVANTPPLASENSNRIYALGFRHRF